MTKCSARQLLVQLAAANITSRWAADGSSHALHPNLTIFDTRMTNVDRMYIGQPLLRNLIAIPLLHPWETPLCGKRRSPAFSVYVTGRCHGPKQGRFRRSLALRAQGIDGALTTECAHVDRPENFQRKSAPRQLLYARAGSPLRRSWYRRSFRPAASPFWHCTVHKRRARHVAVPESRRCPRAADAISPTPR